MSSCKDTIVEILEEKGCFSQESMITPEALLECCIERGIKDIQQIESAIVALVDGDIVEYEMDANLKTSELWLLKE